MTARQSNGLAFYRYAEEVKPTRLPSHEPSPLTRAASGDFLDSTYRFDSRIAIITDFRAGDAILTNSRGHCYIYCQPTGRSAAGRYQPYSRFSKAGGNEYHAAHEVLPPRPKHASYWRSIISRTIGHLRATYFAFRYAQLHDDANTIISSAIAQSRGRPSRTGHQPADASFHYELAFPAAITATSIVAIRNIIGAAN